MKPNYIRCPYHEKAKIEIYRNQNYMVTKRSNGKVEVKGCQDCNGYNIWCDVYKDIMDSRDDSSRNNLQGGSFRVD